jgi:hypothetical protein
VGVGTGKARYECGDVARGAEEEWRESSRGKEILRTGVKIA